MVMTSHDLAAAADVTDPERRHGFGAAVAEYQRLLEVYPSLGYEVTILPKIGVSERADFVLKRLP